MIEGIHHVKLPVSDLARSRSWYEQTLGFRVTIEFVEDGEVKGVAITREGCGPALALRHDPGRAKAMAGFDPIALLVGDRDDVHAWAAALDQAGQPHGGVVVGHQGGAVLVGLLDPDGIEIRLYAD
ncbi:VOC family protein [Gordonia sp. ABSL11-1]|nr:VOC family protein [Gordonia sp. ABSL11-1]MDL9947642.1 VOC family protein [Gordonia sp. ABSL11-1]